MNDIIWCPGMTMADVEKKVLLKALSFYNNNKTHTANALGISVRSIYDKLDEYEKQQQEKANEQNQRA